MNHGKERCQKRCICLGQGGLSPFHRGGPFWSDWEASFEGKLPSVDVIDRDEEVLIRAELPGVDKKDLDVSMTDNSVTIKGSTSTEKEEERGRVASAFRNAAVEALVKGVGAALDETKAPRFGVVGGVANTCPAPPLPESRRAGTRRRPLRNCSHRKRH